jgi:GT2 family glycosyltransferase
LKTLTIVVPYFNKAEALKETHAELKLQLDPDDSVVVIDDFSPNGVPELNCQCTRIVKPPTKLEPHVYRLNTLRNIGIREAKTDAVIILDPDCVPSPNLIKNAKALFDPSILYAGAVDRRHSDNSISLDKRIPERVSKWIDTDPSLGGGGLVWGGVMMFSKAKALSVGGFDEEFDGAWGAEEHEFASRCYHSGMRLYYSMELGVTHINHPNTRVNPSRNMNLWRQKTSFYRDKLNAFTPYKPMVGVSVITMMRPELIDQCLRSVFRGTLPVRVRLVVNGDTSEATKKAVAPWRGRWAVEVVEQEREWPAIVRNESFEWSRRQGFKYHIGLDDDISVFSDGLHQLVWAMKKNPSLYACSGFMRYANGKETMLGGPLVHGAYSSIKRSSGTFKSDWVGGGFTAHWLEPFLPYDDSYEMGYNDYDWSEQAKKNGYLLGVCGDAGAWHGAIFTREGVKDYQNPPDYRHLRYDNARHQRMSDYFKSKWGFEPRTGQTVDETMPRLS